MFNNSRNNSRNPDDVLVVTFGLQAVPNPAKTLEAGREICDDIEVCTIRIPGSRDFTPQPAHMRSHWQIDPFTGTQTQITYAERFPREYAQWKAHAQQTKTGTPLTHVPFITPGKQAELRALNVYTLEQLAHVDGQELKNLGQGGRDLKNQALEYIEQSKTKAPDMQMKVELEALRLKAQLLQEDNELLKQKAIASGEAQFDDMNEEQLTAFIKTHTGHTPQGNLPRKTLVRMAVEARPSRAA